MSKGIYIRLKNSSHIVRELDKAEQKIQELREILGNLSVNIELSTDDIEDETEVTKKAD